MSWRLGPILGFFMGANRDVKVVSRMNFIFLEFDGAAVRGGSGDLCRFGGEGLQTSLGDLVYHLWLDYFREWLCNSFVDQTAVL